MSERLQQLADQLTERSVGYHEEPINLRAGGSSHWYVDLRRGLSGASILKEAASLIIERAQSLGIQYELVAGSGVAGRALAIAVTMISPHEIAVVLANDDKNDTDPKNGYGLYGAPVDGRTVLAVDDIGTTGNSLTTLIDMVRNGGGIVEYAMNLADRSRGRAAQALADMGVAYHALLTFDEENGLLQPIPFDLVA